LYSRLGASACSPPALQVANARDIFSRSFLVVDVFLAPPSGLNWLLASALLG
jgi:hypothetical protein